MNKLNSNNEVKSELHKEYKLIISITVFFADYMFCFIFCCDYKEASCFRKCFY